jgi:cation transport regulator ChaC
VAEYKIIAMNYFAYGSNMLEERLKSKNRVPGATFQAVGIVLGYKLRFHKGSIDNSGKCNIIRTGSPEDVVHGVVFEIPDDQLRYLDRAEGKGHGYHHEYITVRLADGAEMSMLVYVADFNAINDKLVPYTWYHMLVVAGAEQHRLPPEYIEDLRSVRAAEDPESNRPSKLEAEDALNAYYSKNN